MVALLKHIKMSFVLSIIATAAIIAGTNNAVAGDNVSLKMTEDASKLISVMALSLEQSSMPGVLSVKLTYQALKNCNTLSIFVSGYTKDDVKLPNSGMFQQVGVTTGQKFQGQAFISYEPGGYLLTEKAFCY